MKYSDFENTIINNASKDYTGYLMFNILKNTKKDLIFINSFLDTERLKNNLSLLDKGIKIINICDVMDFYNFSSLNTTESANFIKSVAEVINNKNIQKVIVLDYKVLLKKVPPKEFFMQKIELLKGDNFNYTEFTKTLFEFGYTKTDTVFEVGEFATRGMIIDIGTLEGFIRIEFENNVVISINNFNTETQRKIQNKEEQYDLTILPIKFTILTEGSKQMVKNQINKLELNLEKDFLQKLDNFYNLGLHNFLPLFYKNLDNILDFVGNNCIFLLEEDVFNKLESLKEEGRQIYLKYIQNGKSFLEPNLIFTDIEVIKQKISSKVMLSFYNKEIII